MVESCPIAEWSVDRMPFEYRTKFSLVFWPPSEYRTTIWIPDKGKYAIQMFIIQIPIVFLIHSSDTQDQAALEAESEKDFILYGSSLFPKLQPFKDLGNVPFEDRRDCLLEPLPVTERNEMLESAQQTLDMFFDAETMIRWFFNSGSKGWDPPKVLF